MQWQDSNDSPNKLSRRTAMRSQTSPVCNKGITQFYLPTTHRPYFCPYFPVARQPPFNWYQVILLGDRGIQGK